MMPSSTTGVDGRGNAPFAGEVGALVGVVEEEPLVPVGQHIVESHQTAANRGLGPAAISALWDSDQLVERPGRQMKELKSAGSEIPTGMALVGEFVCELRFGARLRCAPVTSKMPPQKVASGVGSQAEELGFLDRVAVATQQRCPLNAIHKLRMSAVGPRSSRTAEPPWERSAPSE